MLPWLPPTREACLCSLQILRQKIKKLTGEKYQPRCHRRESSISRFTESPIDVTMAAQSLLFAGARVQFRVMLRKLVSANREARGRSRRQALLSVTFFVFISVCAYKFPEHHAPTSPTTRLIKFRISDLSLHRQSSFSHSKLGRSSFLREQAEGKETLSRQNSFPV